jgi:hypothetical protein
MKQRCTHLDSAKPQDNLFSGCEECLASGRLDWVRLRVCQECGHVGCCDRSPGKHAMEHFYRTGHPLIRAHEPSETWSWCYVDEIVFDLEEEPPPLRPT